MAAPSAQATLTLQDAFERFASTVTPEDKQIFHNTQLKDVREEAMRIERQLRARRMQRNMARLDPFLRGMEHYSKVVEVLCNGTPYLAWIWAPVKLMLTIAVDSISAFEKLIEAYGKIADMLPRLDRLNHALADDHNFQNVLALVYSDIVEFHRRAYKFVRRKSWTIFFGSMWAGFESRFNGILKNLAYHGGLVDKEAAAAEISEAVRQTWADLARQLQAKIQKVLAWLETNETFQADILERYMGDYLPGSCEWFVQHNETQLWLGDSAKNSLLWLCGKPGAGKSMICSSVIQHAEANTVHIFYYFYSFLGSHSNGPTRLLRAIISQVIQKHQDLAIYVHDVYFTSHPIPTKKALLSLLPELLQGLGSVRLVIDGMFLWVSLVLKSLDTVYSPEELRTIVDDLPSDLENLYNQIFIRLCSAPGARNYGSVSGIMSWICFAQRPLHKSELLHALSMFPYKSSSQVQSIPVASILDHCKPLIEELPDSTIVPVRFSVKE
ncbi:hypothetical protein COCHEDRAFT_1116517 [Bipolaris maydis C5]|uniref:NACHT domain-containing protein n=1 Tax=Cochliobolus heterostrophus (strain C5 / ATCC 48332 / race O) TaxID=701091 RepID=M2TIT1_COCH5|nr:hypothetical protein COCHEDRAFT_1116517 [Bipolaris maydis C5]KAJ6214031.1 hypothetical protein PSV09DRAFT_1116517 [Bipolaris maydis]